MKLTSDLKFKKTSYFLVILFLIVSLAVYFYFGFYHIGKFVTTDEQFWLYERIPAYWEGLTSGKIKKTHINDKPGVTLAIISGAGLLFEKNPEKNHELDDDLAFDSYETSYTEKMYSFFRFPIFIFNGLFSVYLFWIIKKVTKNKWVALWSIIFILLSPLLLGISRVVNPDALLWSFSTAAVFTYLASLIFEKEKKFVFLAALFTGLALLSKYVANILFLFYLSGIFWYYFSAYSSRFKNDPSASSKFLISQVRNFFIILIGACLVFSILMPSVILKPNQLFLGTIGFSGFKPFALPVFSVLILIFIDSYFQKGRFFHALASKTEGVAKLLSRFVYALLGTISLAVIANWTLFGDFLNLGRIPIDARDSLNFLSDTNFFEKVLLEFYPLVFSITPLVLFFILILWLKNSLNKKGDLNFLCAALSFFILIFIAGGMAQGILLTPRYMIALFPILGFLAALGINQIAESKKVTTKTMLTILVLILSIISLWKSQTFYYVYAQDLLPKKFIVSSAWGFGGYEAAAYLNSLPDSQNLIIWTDYRGTCEFFQGKCLFNKTPEEFKNSIDYYVLTRRGQARRDFVTVNIFSDTGKKPVWELKIDGREENYIKIYKGK